MIRLITIAALLTLTSTAYAWDNEEIAVADAEEGCGISEWNGNSKQTEEQSLEDYYECVMDTGAIQDNSGDYWNGFLRARKAGLV